MKLVMPVHPALGLPGHTMLAPLPVVLASIPVLARVQVAITPTVVLEILKLPLNLVM